MSSIGDHAMKVAYVHVLPLEYYPPARNTLTLFSRRPGWEIRAWSSDNNRGLPAWSESGITIRRPGHGDPARPLPLRAAGYAAWHLKTAKELHRWRPDIVIAVEPHSALAVWIYYSALGGGAPLFIHHHEYYSPADYEQTGMRLLRAARRIERDSLFQRAVWVSQTNEKRLTMLAESQPGIRPEALRVLPNYPPEEWISRGSARVDHEPGPTRLVYVGSASFEDTFMREAAQWVASNPRDLTLHVTGDNVAPAVWDWLESLNAANISTDRNGIAYSRLPELLAGFDAGLVLYKGNTLNFVHNVPNKAVEYLACGLEAWYPPEMEGMRKFHELHPELRIRQIDYRALPAPWGRVARQPVGPFPFTCESALAALVREIEAAGSARG